MKRQCEVTGPAPHKWRKYELLELYGLADIDYLRRSIRRFPKSQSDVFLSVLRREVETSARTGEEHLFVIKFVPRKLSMLLPNIRVQNISDLTVVEGVVRGKRSSKLGNYEEIWFCRTNVSANRFSVAGRVLIDSIAGKNAQLIEQVWRCSPRLIEALGTAFPYPFLRAVRSGWGWTPRIAEIHMPPNAPESETIVRAQFALSMRMLERARERIETFVEAILALGLDVCCMEYKIEGARLQIIDWDTTNDSLVIKKLLQK